MNYGQDRENSHGGGSEGVANRPIPGRKVVLYLRLLSLILAVEALVMVGAVVVLLVDLMTQRPASISSAVALTVLVGLGAAWVVALFFASLRAKVWVRGGALIWQLIQFAIAVGTFQGETAQPLIGVLILIPTIAGILILLSKPITVALRREVPGGYQMEKDIP